MKIFLSYASEDRGLAERTCRVLETDGHDVFFDHDDLGGGDAFGQRIREAIQRSHVLVYLISQSSVAPASYALTELSIATGIGARRRPAFLPVRTDATPMESVPAALRAFTVLEPQGDVPAEIASAVARIDARRRRRLTVIAAGVVPVAALGVVAFLARGAFAPPPAIADAIAPASRTAPESKSKEATPISVDPSGLPIGPNGPMLPVTPEAIEALNNSMLSITPADKRVTLIGMPGGDGWVGTLILVDQSATKIEYRIDDAKGYTETGSSDYPNPMTGQLQPNNYFPLPGALWRSRKVDIKYTDSKGREHGPFPLQFEPRTQFVRFAKQSLAFAPWITFDRNAAQHLANFATLVAFKPAFREIRYSIDNDSYDRVLPLKREKSETWPGGSAEDVTSVKVPASAAFIAVKLVFVDDTEQARTFEVQ